MHKEREHLGLVALIRSIARVVGEYIHLKGRVGKERVLAARADRARLVQVVFNLVENAAKYSPQDKPIEIRAQQQAGHVSIEVIDQGQGIPPEALPHIFERFYCVESAVNYSDSGSSGVGLALVKALVESMNGEVTVASEPGQGSCFRITLQCISESPEEKIGEPS